jgi:hypothetical protein
VYGATGLVLRGGSPADVKILGLSWVHVVPRCVLKRWSYTESLIVETGELFATREAGGSRGYFVS